MSETTPNAVREAVARRIRALMAKTEENGASEAEAMAAAAKARQLMDAYRLTQSDVEIEAEPVDDVLLDRPNAQQLAAVDDCLGGINRYCGIKSWFTNRYTDGQNRRLIRMLGLRTDVEMARFLYQMLAATIRSETDAYMRGRRGCDATETRRMSQSFQIGMARRVNERLHAMAQALEPTAKTSTGTALVVVKDAVVSQAFDNLGIKFGRPIHGRRARDGNAFNHGRAAGDRVNLSHPVSNGATKALT